MEIINQPPVNTDKCTKKSWKIQGHYMGVMFIASGILVLLSNFDIINTVILDLIFSWEVLLIALGGYLIACNKHIAGSIIALFGTAAMIINGLNIDIPIEKVSIPLLLTIIGVYFFKRKR